MIGLVTTLKGDTVPAESGGADDRLQTVARALAGIVIVGSAFHFWPFEGNKIWQALCPSNAGVLIWILISAFVVLLKRGRGKLVSSLPHLSVFAYVIINVLSIGFAGQGGRAINFTSKLAMILVGGYTLFSFAIFSKRTLKMVYGLMVLALATSVCSCLVARFWFLSEGFGFYGNAYKYGTYIGILTPICGTYLLTGGSILKKLAGGAVVIGAVISAGSLGAAAAISAAMMSLAIICARRPVLICVIFCLLFAIAGLVTMSSMTDTTFGDDFRLTEKDGINLMQRYIEWQSEINILGERSITGTGAGCINEYRSNFYYRLPKLNTLKAFDQNGWLATGAEAGISGLVCFCWIIVHYFKIAFYQAAGKAEIIQAAGERFAKANFAGFVGACVANLFSSVQYNGILIIFVLVLVLIEKTDCFFGGTVKCE